MSSSFVRGLSHSADTHTGEHLQKGKQDSHSGGNRQRSVALVVCFAFVCSSIRAASSLRCFRLFIVLCFKWPGFVHQRPSAFFIPPPAARIVPALTHPLHFLMSPLLSIRVFGCRLLEQLLVELAGSDRCIRRPRLKCLLLHDQPAGSAITVRQATYQDAKRRAPRRRCYPQGQNHNIAFQLIL